MASSSQNSKNNVKSRLSNDAIAKDPISRQELPLKIPKKRGVYVEQKLTTTNIGMATRQEYPSCSASSPLSRSGRQRSTSPRSIIRKSSPVNQLKNSKLRFTTPKVPDKSMFIASTLNVLDQTNANTQNSANRISDRKIEMQKLLPATGYDEALKREESFSRGERKHISYYRSQALEKSSKESRPVVVLQPRKAIVQTPSTYSKDETGPSTSTSVRFTGIRAINDPVVYNVGGVAEQTNDFPKIKKAKFSNSTEHIQNNSNIESSKVVSSADTDINESVNDDSLHGPIVTSVLEGLHKELSHATIAYMEARAKTEKKENENIYNLFINMVKEPRYFHQEETQYHNLPDRESSAINLIQQTLMNRGLNIPVVDVEGDDYYQDSRTYSNPSLSLINVNSQYIKGHSPVPRRKPQLQAKRHLVPKKNENKPKKNDPKKTDQKSQKLRLLSLIRRELTTNAPPIEEPSNIFEALQLIAKNKIKSQKQLRFNESRKNTTSRHGDPECMFKRKRILSGRKFKPKNQESGDITVRPATLLNKKTKEPTKPESNHSIKVYAYQFLNTNRVKYDISSDDTIIGD